MWTIMCIFMCVGIDMHTYARKGFLHKHKSRGLVIASFSKQQVIWSGCTQMHHTHVSLCTQKHRYMHFTGLNSDSRDLKSFVWAFPHLLDKPVPRGQVSQWKQLWHQEPVPWERLCLFLHHHPETPPPSPPQPPRFQARHQSKREKPGTQLGCSWNPIYFLNQFLHIGSKIYSSLMSSCIPEYIPK